MFLGLVVLGKGGAALLAQRLLGFDRQQGLMMAGLSIPQAAATLAVTSVGLEIGLFGPETVNAVIALILVSVLVGATLVQRVGRRVALAHIAARDDETLPHRALVPLANPDTAERLLDLAFLLRDPASHEAVYPLTVVSDGGPVDAKVAAAERVLAHAVVYAAEADVPVVPLTRVAVNPASGITAAARERRITDIVIGWQGTSAAQRSIFGSVIDQVVEQSTEQVLICRFTQAIAMSRGLFVVLPAAVDINAGFHEAVRTLKGLSAQLGTGLRVTVVHDDAHRIARRFAEVPIEAPVEVESAAAWPALMARLRDVVSPEDLVVVVGARRGTVAWTPALERVPREIAGLGTNFIALYPTERAPGFAGDSGLVALPLVPERVVLELDSPELERALERLLATVADPSTRAFRDALRALVLDDVGYSAEVLPDTVLAHARSTAVDSAAVAIGLRRGGLRHSRAGDLVLRVVVLVSPADEDVAIHLARLARLAQRLRDVPAVELLAAGSADDVVAILRAHGGRGGR
jgi:nucleotide-binding universal stress UspA family protein